MWEFCRKLLAALHWMWLQGHWVSYWSCEESLSISDDSQADLPGVGRIRVYCRFKSTERNLIFLILINSDKLVQETSSSRVWPYYTPWTLADVKTAAWLVEKGHLTQLETVVFTSDLDTSTVSRELESIKDVATNKLKKSDEGILGKLKGSDIFCC